MKNEYQRDFTILVPSTLLFDWLFEFQCCINFPEAQVVVIRLKENTIGCVQLHTANPGELWKIWLYVWRQCVALAFDYAVKANVRDAAHCPPRRVKWPIVQE